MKLVDFFIVYIFFIIYMYRRANYLNISETKHLNTCKYYTLMIIMIHNSTKRKKHMIKSFIDEGLINDLANMGELRISSNGRVLGLEAFLRRVVLRKYRR